MCICTCLLQVFSSQLHVCIIHAMVINMKLNNIFLKKSEKYWTECDSQRSIHTSRLLRMLHYQLQFAWNQFQIHPHRYMDSWERFHLNTVLLTCVETTAWQLCFGSVSEKVFSGGIPKADVISEKFCPFIAEHNRMQSETRQFDSNWPHTLCGHGEYWEAKQSAVKLAITLNQFRPNHILCWNSTTIFSRL